MIEWTKVRPRPTPTRVAAWVRRVRHGHDVRGLTWWRSVRSYGRLFEAAAGSPDRPPPEPEVFQGGAPAFTRHVAAPGETSGAPDGEETP